MFDFIPLYNYTYYFNVAVLLMVLLAFWQCNQGIALKKDVVSLNAIWGFIFTVVLVFYMGLRPISAAFGDTVSYAHTFRMIAGDLDDDYVTIGKGEWVFRYIQYWFAKYSDLHSFFLFCAFLYIVPLWIAMYRLFRSYYYIPFLVVISMFTFWTYGTNGIRNGIASSLVILAFTFANRKLFMFLLCFLAVGIHKSLWLLIIAALTAWFIKNTSIYVLGWFASILLSAAFGSMISNYLVASGIVADERFENYLNSSLELSHQFSSTGFRWDFLAFSALPVLVGYYFIFRRQFRDEYYQWIYSIYLMANAFWIIVIRAQFSNRFAQISWFIMPIVLIYPFLKQRFWINHEKILGLVLLVFYAYTFYTTFL